MTFRYVKAKRENINLMVGFAGASQSGKTYSAMMMAQALAGGPFAMVDTECKRGLHYADSFDFEHVPMASPFTPDAHLEKVRELVGRGFRCVLIDSMSHEWAGVGGVLDMAEKSSVKSPGNWARPKAAHKRMVDGFLQTDAHLVFCMRAHEKIKIEKQMVDGREKTVVLPLGWMPVCEKNWMFEMTVSFTMHPDRPGMVDYGLPHKCPDLLKPLFVDGTRVTRDMGEALGEWARGGEANHPHAELWRDLRNLANQGTVKLRDHIEGLGDDDREAVKPIRRELWNTAKAADAASAGPAPSADDYPERYEEDAGPDEGGYLEDEGGMRPLDNESADPSADDASNDAGDQQQGGLNL